MTYSNTDITLPVWFAPAAVVCGLMFAVSPVLIAYTPYESEMGLVQKIFYYHLPSAWMFLLGGIVCGVASARYLATRNPRHDRAAWAAAELIVSGSGRGIYFAASAFCLRQIRT